MGEADSWIDSSRVVWTWPAASQSGKCHTPGLVQQDAPESTGADAPSATAVEAQLASSERSMEDVDQPLGWRTGREEIDHSPSFVMR